ncbi:MAG: NAD(P)H-dependent oxidoreductase [Pseudomonadota bacterium]
MHTLIIIDNPKKNSFTHAAAERFAEGLSNAGHSYEFADLHAEGFSPIWTVEDDEAPPTDILREQARIARAQAICMAFPLYWFGMPAMTKGWIDRVWSWGWAYDQLDDPTLSLQPSRKATLLIPAGGNPESWEPRGYVDAMETIWRKGTLGYFGMKDADIQILGGSEGSEARREGLLQRAYDLGAAY